MSSHPRRLLATLLCAAAWQPASATAFVEGEALYRERMLPPPGATLIVTLEDVSRADAKATEIASARRLVAGAPPYRWRIGYDAALAAAPRRLALRASIVSADGLWMTTDTFVPLPDPPASAAPSLRLVRVAEPAAAPPGVDCAAASTQAEMAQCAHADFLAASAACSALRRAGGHAAGGAAQPLAAHAEGLARLSHGGLPVRERRRTGRLGAVATEPAVRGAHDA